MSSEAEPRSEGPLVVKAWAPWCGSCRALAPVVDAVSEERGVEVLDVRVDVDVDLVDRFGIRSVPTLIAMRDGNERGRLVGLQPADSVAALFDSAVDRDAAVPQRAPSQLVALRGVVAASLVAAGSVLGSTVIVAVGLALAVWSVSGFATNRMRR